MRCTLLLFVPAMMVALTVADSLKGQEAKAESGLQKKVADLVQELRKDDAESKVTAAKGLAELGAHAEAAVADLVAALRFKGEDVRLNAAIALSKIGSAAVPALAKELDANDTNVRFHALSALGWIGPGARATAPIVVPFLQDKDASIRRKAAYALGRIAGDPTIVVPELVKTFQDANEDVRKAGADSLGKLGAPAAFALIEVLKSKDQRILLLALHALGEIGPDAKAAVPSLKILFLDPERNLLHQSAKALAKIGKASISVFVDALKSDRGEVRYSAIHSLAAIGADAAPALLDVLSDVDLENRRLAAEQLARLKIDNKLVVIGLANALKDQDEQVRQHAVKGLHALGNAAHWAIPQLQLAMLDSDPGTRVVAFRALEVMGEEPRANFAKVLMSDDAKTRIYTAITMASVGHDVKEALRILSEEMKVEDIALRVQVAWTLSQHRQVHPKLQSTFVEALRNKSAVIRHHAVEGVHHQDGKVPEAAVAMVDLLKDPSNDLRQLAIVQLSRYAGNSEVLGAVAKMLKNDDASVRYITIEVLSQHGPLALPIIMESVLDPDDSVRAQANHFLKNLPGDLQLALPNLGPLLKRKEPAIREAAVDVLSRMGDAGVNLLVDALQDDDDNVRRTVVKLIADHSEPIAKAAAILFEMATKDKAANIRYQATKALVRTGDDNLAKLIKIVEESKDAELRAQTCKALALTGANTKVMTPFLLKNMRDESDDIRRHSTVALGHLGPQFAKADDAESKQVIAALEVALKDSNQTVRIMAFSSLGGLGQINRPSILTALKDAKTAKDTHSIKAYLQIMSGYKYSSKDAVPECIEMFKDFERSGRMHSARILASIGPDASAALPVLRAALEDEDEVIRNHAQMAITAIEKK